MNIRYPLYEGVYRILTVIFTLARGKAFSGTENGFVAYKTHLAIF